MTSKTCPRRARMNKGAIRGPKTAERGGLISSLALQLEQTRLLHASKLRKNGVATSCLQTGQGAINQTHHSRMPYCAVLVPPCQWQPEA